LKTFFIIVQNLSKSICQYTCQDPINKKYLMKITPLEIRQHTFEKTFRGYEIEEVDAFLASLSQEWDRVLNDSKMLRMQLEIAEKEANKLREIEMTLFKTLKTAEDTSTMITNQANQQAEKQIGDAQGQSESIVAEAQLKAKSIIKEAEEKASYVKEEVMGEVHDLQKEFKNLEKNKNELVLQLKSLASGTIDHVNRFEQKFNAEIIDNKVAEAEKILADGITPPTVVEEPLAIVEEPIAQIEETIEAITEIEAPTVEAESIAPVAGISALAGIGAIIAASTDEEPAIATAEAVTEVVTPVIEVPAVEAIAEITAPVVEIPAVEAVAEIVVPVVEIPAVEAVAEIVAPVVEIPVVEAVAEITAPVIEIPAVEAVAEIVTPAVEIPAVEAVAEIAAPAVEIPAVEAVAEIAAPVVEIPVVASIAAVAAPVAAVAEEAKETVSNFFGSLIDDVKETVSDIKETVVETITPEAKPEPVVVAQNASEQITDEMLERVNKVKLAIKKAMLEKPDPTIAKAEEKGGSFFDEI
jgi:DivIVA domain-containing protein